MVESFKKMLLNYADFEHRTSRHDYWYAVLGYIIISIVLGAVAGFFGKFGSLVISVFGLVMVIPSLSMAIRRLHDTNKSGYYILLGLIPLVGWIISIVLMCGESVNEGNQYGDEVV